MAETKTPKTSFMPYCKTRGRPGNSTFTFLEFEFRIRRHPFLLLSLPPISWFHSVQYPEGNIRF